MVGDNIRQAVSSTTGTPTTSFTLGSAVTGFNTIGSQYSDGDTLMYYAIEGTTWQLCVGIYTASGTTLSVGTILKKSVSGTVTDLPTGESFTSSAEIVITDSALGKNNCLDGLSSDILSGGYFTAPNMSDLSGQNYCSGQFNAAVGRIGLNPYFFAFPTVITTVACEVTTASAGDNFRILLYSIGSQGEPTTKIYESASLSTAATGFVSETLSSPIVVPAGFAFYAGTYADNTTVRLRGEGGAARQFKLGLGYGSFENAQNIGSLCYNSTFGSAPADLTATSTQARTGAGLPTVLFQ